MPSDQGQGFFAEVAAVHGPRSACRSAPSRPLLAPPGAESLQGFARQLGAGLATEVGIFAQLLLLIVQKPETQSAHGVFYRRRKHHLS